MSDETNLLHMLAVPKGVYNVEEVDNLLTFD